MAAAWDQVGEVLRANQQLRQAEMAVAAATRVFRRRLVPLADDLSLLAVAAPAVARIPFDAARTVRDIVEANRYLVLATADATGRPWSSPVYFAHDDFTRFFWVSSPDVTHSRNIAVRPLIATSRGTYGGGHVM